MQPYVDFLGLQIRKIVSNDDKKWKQNLHTQESRQKIHNMCISVNNTAVKKCWPQNS